MSKLNVKQLMHFNDRFMIRVKSGNKQNFGSVRWVRAQFKDCRDILFLMARLALA